MILAHHGYGEELITYVLVGAGGAGSGLALIVRAKLDLFTRWLRRK
jgi:hypothetical protein